MFSRTPFITAWVALLGFATAAKLSTLWMIWPRSINVQPAPVRLPA
jgi:hypothetical protein